MRNMYSMFRFISESLLWFYNDHASQWQQEARQVRGLHVPGRAGDMRGSVFLLLQSVNKLVCWSGSLPGSG